MNIIFTIVYVNCDSLLAHPAPSKIICSYSKLQNRLYRAHICRTDCRGLLLVYKTLDAINGSLSTFNSNLAAFSINFQKLSPNCSHFHIKDKNTTAR